MHMRNICQVYTPGGGTHLLKHAKSGLTQAKTSETPGKVIALTNTATAAKLVTQKMMIPYSTPSRWLPAPSVHVGLPEAPAAARLHAYLTTDRWLTILSVCSPCTAFSSAAHQPPAGHLHLSEGLLRRSSFHLARTNERFLAQHHRLLQGTSCRGASTLPDAAEVVRRAHCGTAIGEYRPWAVSPKSKLDTQRSHKLNTAGQIMVTSDTTAEDRGSMKANSGSMKFPKTRSRGKYIRMKTDSIDDPLVTVRH